MQDEEYEVYMKGFEKGQEHKKPSQETQEMISEWRKLKWIAFTIIFGIGSWVGTMQYTVNSLEKSMEYHDNEDKEFQKKIQANEIANTEIKTKLVNIESTLLDIRNALKIH